MNWDVESRMLRDLDYTLFDSDLPLGERQPLTDATFNIIGIPSEDDPASNSALLPSILPRQYESPEVPREHALIS